MWQAAGAGPGDRRRDAGGPLVVATAASEGRGIDDLLGATEQRRSFLRSHEGLQASCSKRWLSQARAIAAARP